MKALDRAFEEAGFDLSLLDKIDSEDHPQSPQPASEAVAGGDHVEQQETDNGGRDAEDIPPNPEVCSLRLLHDCV